MRFLDITNFRDLATYLGMEPKDLGYILMKLPKSKLYTDFEVPKKSGGTRSISAPILQLRNIQNRLKTELENHYKPTTSAHGFIKKKSIVTNANRHVNKDWVLNIDLKDFFPSVTSKRVYGLFMAKPFGFTSKVASFIANILTYKGSVPQGGTCSPIITNMICYRMDKALMKYCKKYSIEFTRYADDMTFSALDRDKLMKVYDEENNNLSVAIDSIIKSNGFEVNPNKIRCNMYFKHQEVTGVKTNIFPNISHFQKYKVRAMLHAWQKFGLENTTREYMIKRGFQGEVEENKKKFIDELHGHIAFVKMVLGLNHPFYSRIAHEYNCLRKRTYFKVFYPIDTLYDNSVFSFIYNGLNGVIESQSVAFYCQEQFYTCLHNTYPEQGFQLLRELGNKNAIIRYVNSYLKRSKLVNKYFDENHEVDLSKALISYISVERDLIIFKVPGFFSPYSLVLSKKVPDRRHKFTLTNMEFSSYEVDAKTCKLAAKRMMGGFNGYPISIHVEQGMSGSPILEMNTNRVVGYISYGADEIETGNTSYRNGMYDFVDFEFD